MIRLRSSGFILASASNPLLRSRLVPAISLKIVSECLATLDRSPDRSLRLAGRLGYRGGEAFNGCSGRICHCIFFTPS
jgi:hypothetical protein